MDLQAAKRKATSQIVEGLTEGEQRTLPVPHFQPVQDPDDDLGDTHDRFSLHPDDPKNFLKLCSAIRLLIRRRLIDHDIDRADALLRDYCAELIPVCVRYVMKYSYSFLTLLLSCMGPALSNKTTTIRLT